MAQKQGMHGELAEPDLFSGHITLPAVVLNSVAETEEMHPLSKADQAFKTISETADMLSLPQHVLRFWESKFAQIKPLKLRGGRRYYRPQDIEALFAIKHLLYKEGYTIKGARRAIVQSKKRKSKEDSMAENNAPRKKLKARPVADAPLFSGLMESEAPEGCPSSKRDALKQIHRDLLELRELITALPPLSVP